MYELGGGSESLLRDLYEALNEFLDYQERQNEDFVDFLKNRRLFIEELLAAIKGQSLSRRKSPRKSPRKRVHQ